jgi:hypothetical protein
VSFTSICSGNSLRTSWISQRGSCMRAPPRKRRLSTKKKGSSMRELSRIFWNEPKICKRNVNTVRCHSTELMKSSEVGAASVI